jgi:EAL domain-containing protein (putative c-di-GMP-specific phosphodiesterase class I)
MSLDFFREMMKSLLLSSRKYCLTKSLVIGFEEDDQLFDEPKEMGVDDYQGYNIGKPLEIKEYLHLSERV